MTSGIDCMATAFVVGSLFAFGLAISGMVLRTKIYGFLTIGPDWDPTLMIVLASAVIPNAIAFPLI